MKEKEPRRGKAPVEAITDPQAETLRMISELIAQQGFPPTMKELADRLGISGASVHDQINQLVRKGYLRREPRKARGIAITEKGRKITDLRANL